MALKTPLYEIHQSEGAKLVDFAGWDMPLHYESITAEHKIVRESAAIFDVSHMGRFFLSGAGALRDINRLVVSNIAGIQDGQTKYTVVCNPEGGAKDDVLVTRLAQDRYLTVVNASNREKLLQWFQEHLSPDTQFEDKTFDVAMIAIQGPESQVVVNSVLGANIDDIEYYTAREMGSDLIVSRTGYTGENGYEIIDRNIKVVEYWKKARENGAKPAGLGCRDSLRLEMGFALYGHELDEETTPLEAGLKWLTHLDKDDFIGKDALKKQQEEGVKRRKIGFVVDGKGIPREGYKLFDGEQEVGTVSSGGFSTTLSQGIGLGFVQSGHTKTDSLFVEIRGKKVPATITKPPFVRKRVKD